MSIVEYVPGVQVIVNDWPATGDPVYVKALSATTARARRLTTATIHPNVTIIAARECY